MLGGFFYLQESHPRVPDHPGGMDAIYPKRTSHDSTSAITPRKDSRKPQRPILKLWALINISICIEFQDNRAFGLTWVDSRSTLDDHHRPRSY